MKIMLKADRSVDSLYQKRAIRTIDVRSHEPEKACYSMGEEMHE